MDTPQTTTSPPREATKLTEELLADELRALYAERVRVGIHAQEAQERHAALLARYHVVEDRLGAVLLLYRQATGDASEYEARCRLGLPECLEPAGGQRCHQPLGHAGVHGWQDAPDEVRSTPADVQA